VSYLAKELEADLEWRLHEIEVVRRKHSQCATGSERKIIVKCLVLMLYAHWEGFVKHALTLYVEALCRTGAKRRQLIDNLVARSLQGTLNRLTDRSIVVRAEFVASLDQLLDATLVIEQEGVNTKANLKTGVFRGLLADYGVYVQDTLVNEFTIDTLVDRRNDIAHGKRAPIEEIDVFLRFYKEIQVLMEELAIAIDRCLDHQSYLKPVAAGNS
jgi:hypothetical protein